MAPVTHPAGGSSRSSIRRRHCWAFLATGSVKESARAHSYYSSTQVRKTGLLWLFPFWLFPVSKVSSTFYVASKSVLYTLHSVKKCLIHVLRAFLGSWKGNSINDSLGNLVALTIIYLVLAWYLAQIFSAGGGSSKPFYFPFQKGYWMEKAAPPAEGTTLKEEQRSTG